MTHKLLLADRSPAVRRVVEMAFADTGVEVISVTDGEEAVVRMRAERPDIVLADIGMPKRSGYDVATYVTSEPELSGTPVLLLAGAFEPVDGDRVRASGSQGVLVKPFESRHVIARVQELLGGGIGVSAPATNDTSWRAPRVESPRSVEPEGRGVPTLEELLGGVAAGEADDETAEPDVLPTLDALLSPTGGAREAAVPVPAPAAAGTDAPDPRQAIAEAFSSLLAADQGRRAGGRPLGASAPAVTDEFVDAVAQRVLGHLAAEGRQAVEGAAAREAVDRQTAAVLERVSAEVTRAAEAAVDSIVGRVVSDVSERLVREEIARIRDKA